MRDILESSKYTNNIGYIINEAAPEEPTKTELVNEIQCGSRRRVVGKGILQSGNEKNRNGRYYDTQKELSPQVVCPRTLELIKHGRLLGENGHPLSKDLSRQQQIIESLCSVRYLKVWMEGNDVWAWYVGHNNALGDTFDDNLRSGIDPSFSLRALGSVNNTSKGAEVVNLKIITWDDVIYPSHPGAYGQGLVDGTELTKADKELKARMQIESAFTEACSMVDSSLLAENAGISRDKMNDTGLITPITNQNVIDYIQRESFNFHMFKESFDLMYDDINMVGNGSQVQLTDKSGNILFVNLENYVHNGLMNYFYDNKEW
jgi:hypothetical protein